ncbi:small conductance mechanosensitive channel [Paenochrobactrum gallinarii]|uniref:Small-conductance mechanosensitive channel n=1 Tax=Paenochrobactrum gallinarii TaxID=643673 RepID=A0A841LW57_9HYPH|nr:mechanosensitive ion channel domain-containing protein [Paenochrobactrum gallinarii]MBB6262413.1 small conductance mechanosensitive channel [Paenochrobactrum gallinarii]
MREQTQQFISNTNEIILQISDLLVTYAFSVIGAIIILLLGWIIAGYLERIAKKSLAKIHGFDATLTGFLSQFIRYGTLLIVLVMVLGQFGIQTASILAALGAIGLAIGLALQGTLQNIAAGLMLLILRPFTVGDYISTSSVAGTVKEVDLFTSELTTYDGLNIVVPNSVLWNTPITNYSRLDTRLHDFQVRISYENDIQAAFQLINSIITAQKGVLNEPEPIYFVADLAENAVVLNCRYWITASEYWNVSRKTVEEVKYAFDKNGISIPYNQIVYHKAVIKN